MIVIIDVNCLPRVFNRKKDDGDEFVDVEPWIREGIGKMIVGGSKYLQELKKMPRYLTLVNELKKNRKVISIFDRDVDNEERRVRQVCRDADFDDPHLVALVCVSKCPMICTADERAMPYLKKREFYPRGVKRPKIYCKKGCASLLSKKGIRDFYS
jgi:hypothetical protein